eukprot:UN23990
MRMQTIYVYILPYICTQNILTIASPLYKFLKYKIHQMNY